ncbi:uncharacterized protein LOC108916714 [Anoplophora glabripennis]|uniref:Nuclease n=1 Tax=Anoplophora glabripennis TaxID=217634 RepID=V5IB13_ANOGL|nr:uncharacterized protein LOC108916714 [Anoplophora glabripennis]
MEELLEILSDEEDFLQLVNIIAHPRAPKTYRNRQNHFEIWNENEFIKRFRLSKNAVRFIIENIENQISSHTDRNHAVSAEEMVLLTLRILAAGAFLQVNADFIGVDKSTASRIVDKVCRAIARLNTTFIKMPQTEEDMQIASQKFYNKSFSKVYRCIRLYACENFITRRPRTRKF